MRRLTGISRGSVSTYYLYITIHPYLLLSTFLGEVTNYLSSTFLGEATGTIKII